MALVGGKIQIRTIYHLLLIRHGSPKNGYWEVIDCGKKNNEDTE